MLGRLSARSTATACSLPDCNGNGVPDDQDPDSDGDGIPDDCEGACCDPASAGCGVLTPVQCSLAGGNDAGDGTYQADPGSGAPVSASLLAGSLTVQEGPQEIAGRLFLQDSMIIEVFGDVTLLGANADDEGDCTPPEFEVPQQSGGVIHGSFAADGVAKVIITSAEPITVGGDFLNHTTDPLEFDWAGGKLFMTGLAQELEAASLDLGADKVGLVENFAFGELELACGATVGVVDLFVNNPNAGGGCEVVYVDTLVINEGATFDAGDCAVYYNQLINQGTVTGNVQRIAGSCPSDFDGSNEVNSADLADLLADWGSYTLCPPFVPSDLDQDCDVDAADLAELLSAWGACE